MHKYLKTMKLKKIIKNGNKPDWWLLDQILKKQIEKTYQWVEYQSLQKKSGKVFKNGPSKICGSQPLKNLK